MRPLTREQAVAFFSTLYGGKHHIPGARYGDAKNCIGQGGPGGVKVCISARERGGGMSEGHPGGGMSEGHPTIEEALARFRELNGEMP